MFTVAATGVTPSVYVKSQGPVPVNVIVISGIAAPAHIVPPPDTVAVGNAFVNTVAEPIKDVPEHAVASDKAVTL